MCNQAEKIFLNFFLKGQGSPALYPIPFIPESNRQRFHLFPIRWATNTMTPWRCIKKNVHLYLLRGKVFCGYYSYAMPHKPSTEGCINLSVFFLL